MIYMLLTNVKAKLYRRNRCPWSRDVHSPQGHRISFTLYDIYINNYSYNVIESKANTMPLWYNW